jgi:hypothetical protein
MRTLKFKAKFPYEIGDRVQFKKPSNAYYKGETKVMEITDIITQISAKTGHIKFILELGGWYKLDTDLHAVDVTRIE